MTEPTTFLGIDLGGTNIKVGVVDASGHSESKVQIPTEAKRGPEHGLERIRHAVEMAIEQSSHARISAIGLAAPGTMDIPAGILLEPPNLPGWINVPLRQQIEDAFQIPTVMQNDANAAAFGEFWVGAGRDAFSMVLWTLGTGLGCGIIIGDTIIQGAHSHGSECGHIIIEADNGRLCTSGHYGELEAYASATALVQRCEEALAAGRNSILSKWTADGRKLTPILIAEAVGQGDSLADELVLDTARYLGVGTTSVMHTIDPDMVLLGGAMTFGRHETDLGRRFLDRVRAEVAKRAFPVPYERTTIDYASLGSDAGYIGAAGIAKQAFEGS